VLIAAALLVTAACSHGDRNASARRPSTSNRLSSVVDGTPASALPLIASPTSTPAVASASAKLPPTVRVGGADILDASAGSRPAFIGQPADVNGRVTDLEGTGFWLGSAPQRVYVVTSGAGDTRIQRGDTVSIHGLVRGAGSDLDLGLSPHSTASVQNEQFYIYAFAVDHVD